MRGALDDKVDEVYRFYTVPASNTAVGHIILENRRARRREVGSKAQAPGPHPASAASGGGSKRRRRAEGGCGKRAAARAKPTMIRGQR